MLSSKSMEVIWSVQNVLSVTSFLDLFLNKELNHPLAYYGVPK